MRRRQFTLINFIDLSIFCAFNTHTYVINDAEFENHIENVRNRTTEGQNHKLLTKIEIFSLNPGICQPFWNFEQDSYISK